MMMAAGDMSCLVCDNANDLVGRFRCEQRAGMDEDAPASHKGVETMIVDENNLDS